KLHDHDKTVHFFVLDRLLKTKIIDLKEECEMSVTKCQAYALSKILKKSEYDLNGTDCVELIAQLIKTGDFIETHSPQSGDLVLYADYAIKHAGVYLGDNKVESKWGSYSFILIHRVDAVPSAYGNTIRYYRYQK